MKPNKMIILFFLSISFSLTLIVQAESMPNKPMYFNNAVYHISTNKHQEKFSFIQEQLNEIYTPLSIHELDGLDISTAINNAAVVSINLNNAEENNIESYASLINIARNAKVPIVIENSNNTEFTSRTLGFGVVGEWILATPNPSGGMSLVVQGRSSIESQSVEGESGNLHTKFSDNSNTTSNMKLSKKPVDATISASRNSELLFENLDEYLSTIHSFDKKPEPFSISGQNDLQVPMINTYFQGVSVPRESYRYYNVSINRQQGCFEEKTQCYDAYTEFVVEVFATPYDKYVRIRPTATNFNPGGLLSDNKWDRHYFSRGITMTLNAEGQKNVVHDRHVPGTTVADHSFSTTTGYSLGLSGTASKPPALGISYSYDSSQTYTQKIPEWSVIDNSEADKLRWTYQLSVAGGNIINNWQDMVRDNNGCRYVRSIPSSAKSTLSPEFESVFRATGDSQTFTFGYEYELWRIWTRNGPDTIFGACEWWKMGVNFRKIQNSTTFQVDFEQVSNPADPLTPCRLIDRQQGRTECNAFVSPATYAQDSVGLYKFAGIVNDYPIYEQRYGEYAMYYSNNQNRWILDRNGADNPGGRSEWSADKNFWPWSLSWTDTMKVSPVENPIEDDLTIGCADLQERKGRSDCDLMVAPATYAQASRGRYTFVEIHNGYPRYKQVNGNHEIYYKKEAKRWILDRNGADNPGGGSEWSAEKYFWPWSLRWTDVMTVTAIDAI